VIEREGRHPPHTQAHTAKKLKKEWGLQCGLVMTTTTIYKHLHVLQNKGRQMSSPTKKICT